MKPRATKQRPWYRRWAKLALLGLVAPTLIGASVGVASAVIQTEPGVVAYARPGDGNNDHSGGGHGHHNNDSGDKDKDKDKDDSDSDSESSSSDSASSQEASTSAWNQALNDLGGSDSKDKDQGGGSKSKEEQAKEAVTWQDISLAGNAWSFMGPTNRRVWQGNNRSSTSAAYSQFIDMANEQDSTKQLYKYKPAARYAYLLYAMGLDQPVKAGFASTGSAAIIGGFIEQVSYGALIFSQKAFDWAITVINMINPITWVIYGTSQIHYFQPLAQWLNQLYNILKNLGLTISVMILLASMAAAAMGIRIGSSARQYSASGMVVNLKDSFVVFLKRLLGQVVMPIMCLSVFGSVTSQMSDLFDTQANSVPNYAVYGSLLDFDSWVTKTNLKVPASLQGSDGPFISSFDSHKMGILTHADLVQLNRDGAGINELSALSANLSNAQVLNNTKQPTVSDPLTEQAQGMISAWRKGTTLTAADYASSQMYGSGGVITKAKSMGDGAKKDDNNGDDMPSDEDIAKALETPKFANNGGLNASGTAGAPFTSSGDKGLSTLGTYAYLLTTASDDKISTANTDQLNNDVALPQHHSVVMAGSGIQGIGNFVWSIGMMAGLALLVFGYLAELVKTIIEAVPALSMSTLQSAAGSIRGQLTMIGTVAGVTCGVVGSAIMFQIAQSAFIGFASSADQLVSQGTNFAGKLTGMAMLGAPSGVAELSSGVSTATLNGTLNLLFGLFLLWLAMLLLKYRSIVVTGLASLVEESLEKINRSFAGDASFRGTVTSSSGAKNTISNSMASGMSSLAGLGTRAAVAGAVLGGGAHAAKEGLNALTGNHGKHDKDGKAAQSEKERQASRERINSMARGSQAQDKLGNAASRTKQSQDQKANNGMGNYLDNNKAMLGMNGTSLNNPADMATMGGQMNPNASQADKHQTGDQHQNNQQLQNLAHQANQGDQHQQNGDQVDQSQLGDQDQSNQLQDLANQTSNDNLAEGDQNQDLGMGDQNGDFVDLTQGDQLQNLANQNGGLDLNQNQGDTIGGQSQNTIGNTIGGTQNQSSLRSLANGQATNVNHGMNATAIRSQMSSIANANQRANHLQNLAQKQPQNQTLAQQAQQAQQSLQHLQSNALQSYNQQAVGSNTPQASWLGQGVNGQNLSVGTANQALSSVYNAQQQLSQAQSQYGVGSSMTQAAEQNLEQARQAAVDQGLSSQLVNSTQDVSKAHDMIAENATQLMQGTWQSNTTSGSDVSHLGQSGSRVLGM